MLFGNLVIHATRCRVKSSPEHTHRRPHAARRHQRRRPRPCLRPLVLGAAAEAVWARQLAVPHDRQPHAVPPAGALQRPGTRRRQQVRKWLAGTAALVHFTSQTLQSMEP